MLACLFLKVTCFLIMCAFFFLCVCVCVLQEERSVLRSAVAEKEARISTLSDELTAKVFFALLYVYCTPTEYRSKDLPNSPMTFLSV